MSEPEPDQQVLEGALRDIMQQCPYVRVGFLFGSVGSDTASFASDIDVAVFGHRPIDTQTRTKLIEQIAAVSGRPVDLVDLRQANPTLMRRVLQQGKRIYTASDRDYAELLKRHIYDQADWNPYRQRILEERREQWIKS